jgi:HSP20 family molecular chaperone IbpA
MKNEKKHEEASQQQREKLEKQQQVEKSQQQKLEREKNILQNMWRSLKFKPDFKINDLPDRFVLSASIPRMKEEDIKITLGQNNETITISGYREPTEVELEKLRKQLALERKRDIHGKYFPPNEDEFKHLLRLGAGRFGQFSETYQIDPKRVNINDIKASYQGGVLQVTIPKYRTQFRPTQSSYPNYGQRSPRNFFHDDDFFW